MSAAFTTFEVEADLSGSWSPGDRSVGDWGGYEDCAVGGLFMLRYVPGLRPPRWDRVDLLAGLDEAAKQTVLENARKFIGDDGIAEALRDDAFDPVADKADYWRDLRKDENQ